MVYSGFRVSIVLVVLGLGCCSLPGAELAVFETDITPPLNRQACIGFVREFTAVDEPLLARGVAVREGDAVYVLCFLDLEGLCNESYDRFRDAVAQAAGTTRERVAVQCLHQHAAPTFDRDAARILYRTEPDAEKDHLEIEQATINKLIPALRANALKWQPCTHVAATQSRVDRVASSRRLEQPDGSIVVRHSVGGKDPALREAPEGLIDPFLKTVSFFNGDSCLVQLHFYATHPQTYTGERITSDVPGLARKRLAKEAGVPQIYVTACGGNIAMGKYNDGSTAARDALVDRLYAAMKVSAERAPAARQPISPLRWNSTTVSFQPRKEAEFSIAANREIADDAKMPFGTRLRSAMFAAWTERLQAGRTVDITSLAIGKVRIVHLPGEPFVQFQLAAQRDHPDLFVCVAGYGECGMWYLGEDRIYTDRGGYEQSWSFVAPCEHDLHEAIRRVLK